MPSITSIGPDWVAKAMSAAWRRRSLVDDLGAAVVPDQEHAVGLQVEIAAAVAAVDRVHLAPVDHRQPDRAPVVVEHPGIHREGHVDRDRAISVGEARSGASSGGGEQLDSAPRPDRRR